MVAWRRLAVGVVALVALAGTWGRAEAGSSSDAGARLMAAMREAPARIDFTGVVEVSWRDRSGAVQRETVDVQATDGVVSLSAGGRSARDDGRTTSFADQLDGRSVLSEPPLTRRPSPDARWALAVRSGQPRLGRTTTEVVASRSDGTIAQRLVIDDATHLPLAREVVERDGTMSRAFVFTELDVGEHPSDPTRITRGVRPARALDDVPDGYRAPDTAGAGYVLVSRSRIADGLQFVYSDGVFSVSLLEQRGELDWGSLPDRGTAARVADARARRYTEPVGDVLVWERDGVVFTCVSDAPRDVLDAMLAGLSPDPGAAERVVDFVLGPFGFD